MIDSPSAKEISNWCLEFYDNHKQAPKENIQLIYQEKLKNHEIRKDIADDIASILESLSEQFENDTTNIDYLVEQTKKFFKKQSLIYLKDELDGLLDTNNLTEAENKINGFKTVSEASDLTIDIGARVTLRKIEKAFRTTHLSLIKYPGDLGEMLNDKMVQGKFVAFFAPEKAGKSFMLLKSALLAVSQQQPTALFQVGDMTEDEVFIRLTQMLSGKTDIEKDTGKQLKSVADCVYNQNDECNRSERACTFGVFEGWDAERIRQTITWDELVETYSDNKEYLPCRNCKYYKGCQWLEEDTVGLLSAREAKKSVRDNIPEHMFKLAVHPTQTLTVKDMKDQLNSWETEGFVPKVIIVDYVDHMIPESKIEYRHGINSIWGGLRGVSQEYYALLITASLTDSDAMKQDTITLNNFSEDRRKIAHVSSLFSLNKSADGREEELGIVRVGELINRHRKKLFRKNQVRVLQNLRVGEPILDSYW